MTHLLEVSETIVLLEEALVVRNAVLAKNETVRQSQDVLAMGSNMQLMVFAMSDGLVLPVGSLESFSDRVNQRL